MALFVLAGIFVFIYTTAKQKLTQKTRSEATV